jgi:hypothetical protein
LEAFLRYAIFENGEDFEKIISDERFDVFRQIGFTAFWLKVSISYILVYNLSENITVMMDVETALSSDIPTASNVITHLYQMVKDSKAGDVLLFLRSRRKIHL